MIFVGYGCPEQGHDPIAPEFADCALKAVDFIDQDPAAAVHDSVDVLRVQLFGEEVNPATSANMTVTNLRSPSMALRVVRILSAKCLGV